MTIQVNRIQSSVGDPRLFRATSPRSRVAVAPAPEYRLSNVLSDFYRCPEESLEPSLAQDLHLTAVEYGRVDHANGDGQGRYSPSADVEQDTSRIVDGLRLERYARNSEGGTDGLLSSEFAQRAYYLLRPLLGASVRKSLQRWFLRDWDRLAFPRWPVDTSVEEIFESHLLLTMKAAGVESVPFIWFWPDGAPSAAVMTHDVEAPAGLAFVSSLIDLDDTFDIKTSFQLVPESRYPVSNHLLETIRQRQCEINVHGLNHDGNLFRDRSTFVEQCKWINYYIQEFGAEGFRSACMYRNVDWYDELNVSYDMSVPNVAHLEPQRGGCCTVFPYFIGKTLELPLTTVQDYSLFHILRDYSIELWKTQIERIMSKHGLISFIAHPDYLLNKRSLDVYKALLGYLVGLREDKKVWVARPGDVNRWWRQRSEMKLVFENGKWCIRGPGHERARIAFAHVQNDNIAFTVGNGSETTSGQRS